MRREQVLIETLNEKESSIDDDCKVASVSDVITLMRNVRKRFKTLPIDGGQSSGLQVDTFIKKFTYSEFADFGMVVAALAFGYRRVYIGYYADNVARKILKANEDELAKFIHWGGGMIKHDPLADKVYTHFNLAEELR